MTGKMLVILMTIIIMALFMWSTRYRRKEKNYTALEAASFEAMKRWRENRNEENERLAIEAHIALARAHGQNPDQAAHNVKQEMARFSE